DPLPGLLVEAAHHARGRAHDQRVVGKFLALGDERAGADQAVAADAGAVEHDRTHADQAVGRNGAAVQHDVVADDAVIADRQREAGIGVQRRIVLDLRALAELDPLVVAAQHRAEPDAGIALEAHAADHARALRDPVAAVGRQLRRHAVELEDRHQHLTAWADGPPASCRGSGRYRRARATAFSSVRTARSSG